MEFLCEIFCDYYLLEGIGEVVRELIEVKSKDNDGD